MVTTRSSQRDRELLPSSAVPEDESNADNPGHLKAVDDTKTSPGDRKKLTASVTGFFSKFRPSKRPERDSDTIPANQWNTPITIPRRSLSMSARGKVSKRYSTDTRRSPSTPVSNKAEIAADDGADPAAAGDDFFVPKRRPGDPATPDPARARHINKAPPVSDRARELFLAKQKARRQRQTLKASGDFLGVTGVNPYTREMDVITPTTSSEDAASPVNSHVAGLARKAEEARKAYEIAARDAQLKKDQEKLFKIGRHKDAIRTAQQRVKWRREGGQWSSAVEPKLSPITQSVGSTTPHSPHSSHSTTIHRRPSPDPFLEIGSTAIVRRHTVSTETSETQDAQGQHKSPPLSNAELEKGLAKAISNPFRSRLPPLIPRRIGSNTKDTKAAKDREHKMKTEKLIDIPSPPRQAHGCPTQQSNTLRRPSSVRVLELENQNPAERWANELVQDLDGLGANINTVSSRKMEAWKGPNGEVGSACTLTTTTIGYVRNRHHPRAANYHTSDAFPEMLNGDRVSPVLTQVDDRTSQTSSRSLGEMHSNAYLDLLASPPDMGQSVWPSLAAQHLPKPTSTATAGRVLETEMETTGLTSVPPAGAASDTTLESQGMPSVAREMRKTMRKEAGDPHTTPPPRTSSPTSTSTSPPSLSTSTTNSDSPMSFKSEPIATGKAMAQGAARAAFEQLQVAPTSKKTVFPNSMAAATKREEAEKGKRELDLRKLPATYRGGNVGTGGRFVRDQNRSLFRTASAVMQWAGWEYWELVRPVFVSDSPLRQRLAQARSTWHDCVIYLLAVIFSLLVTLLGIWCIKGFVFVFSVIKGLA
ncbi:hypothetical protein QBC46DRAFT_445751 [Diplogelasinospora grovesii]|uniref:Uncharacterized protein n=1 Tax=Diplogelasinospora grovesii TaxID=303347 RepID=A0AAN6S8Z3_9PEZI|nr:hypothetical protein QBC46DRAFT_445751 [Diplogelasinospora grovesii]